MKKLIIYCVTILMVSCNQTNTDNKNNDAIEVKEIPEDQESQDQESQDQESQDQGFQHQGSQDQESQDKNEPDTEEDIISDIREKFGAVNYNINAYKKVTKDLMTESSEGGSLEGYFKKEELKKIVTSYYGGMGKLIEEYYFYDNELFFVFTQSYIYDMPMHMDGSKVDKIDENRYYIYNNKLIRWLDPSKVKIDKSKFTKKETEILQNTKNLKEKLKH